MKGFHRISRHGMWLTEAGAWQRKRYNAEATVDWQFTAADARVKLKKLYPVI
jgi:hypothetical protein